MEGNTGCHRQHWACIPAPPLSYREKPQASGFTLLSIPIPCLSKGNSIACLEGKLEGLAIMNMYGWSVTYCRMNNGDA